MIRKLILVFLLLNGALLNPSLAADESSSENPFIFSTDKPEPAPSTTSAAPTKETTTTTKTTEEPTTTTAAPTTKPTTTSAPSSTTTVAPTPTPAPAPKPWPQNIGNWSVSNESETCILFLGALQFVVPYTNEKDNKTNTVHIEVPVNATASGKCEELAQTLTLKWEAEKGSLKLNSVTFTFVYNTNSTATLEGVSANKFALKEVTGTLYANETQNATLPLKEVTFEIEGLDTYQTASNKSFKCESEEILKSKNGEGVQLKVAHAQVEAFRVTKDHTFGPAVECELDGAVADIVPIAVGASLAALVVIVLIAYLIGRRRSRARGYQSV